MLDWLFGSWPTYAERRAKMDAEDWKRRAEQAERELKIFQRGKGKCEHPNAEYDSGGAWCPDCGARGTFPGMG